MKCFVTGASGFLGGALARRLLREGHEVTAVSRRPVPELSALGIQVRTVDLTRNPSEYRKFLKGIDVIFHTAAKVEMWGKRQAFYRTNVQATRDLLQSSKEAGIRRFVYTSSPSVVADGTDLKGIDESYPYPKKHEAYYPETKAIAERLVLAANNRDFYTLALRPHLIFGPGDTNLVPSVLLRARKGKLMRIGKGENIVDFSFIDDCVTAHLLAARALEINAEARGRAYFISQGDPVPLWKWIDKVLQYHQLPPVTKSLSKEFALKAALLSEQVAKYVSFRPPLITRFLVSEMATDHYFSIEAAKQQLGYAPQYGVFEALRLTYARHASSSIPLRAAP